MYRILRTMETSKLLFGDAKKSLLKEIKSVLKNLHLSTVYIVNCCKKCIYYKKSDKLSSHSSSFTTSGLIQADKKNGLHKRRSFSKYHSLPGQNEKQGTY